jgi:WD40 repeat protein
VCSAAFSPDGKRIVTASEDKTARVWDAATGQPIGEPLYGHEDFVTSAAFSPDGARIVTASSDNTARVWDAASGEMLRELKGHGGTVASAAFSPDGARIVTASWDKTAVVWDVSWEMNVRRENLVRRVCAEKLVGGRAFTTADAADPILADLAGQDPCERSGPFAATYWADLGRNFWRRLSGELAALFQHGKGGLEPTRPP